MDYWLGDDALFPSPITEWHTENIYRLDRCFVSWSPPPYLPEASAEVLDTPSQVVFVLVLLTIIENFLMIHCMFGVKF